MLKYKIKWIGLEPIIEISLFAHPEEKELMKEKIKTLIQELQNLELIGKDKLNEVEGEVHGLYRHDFKVECLSARKENQIKKEIEDLGFEEENDETQGED